MVYTAFPDAHGTASGPAPHRHADGAVHVHTEAEAAHAAPERDAGAAHGGLHAHDGRVHTHGLLAHSHQTAPEAVVQRVALRGVPARLGEASPPAGREVTYTDGVSALHMLSRPSVEIPPPIRRG